VPEHAYETIVRQDELRDKIAEKLRDVDELHRGIDRQLATAIERHMRKFRREAPP
jgi:hypothetical protein